MANTIRGLEGVLPEEGGAAGEWLMQTSDQVFASRQVACCRNCQAIA